VLKITKDSVRGDTNRMELVVKDLNTSFSEKPVLTGVDFVFEQGKIYGLLGRNGAGNTTLFNCLGGEMQADSGSRMIAKNS
jgi:ABC-2 type transport system ATP-binding protein